MNVLFDPLDVTGIGNGIDLTKRGDGEIVRTRRLVAAETARAEGTRLAQLDDRPNVRLQAFHLLPGSEGALHEHGEHADHDREQHHDCGAADAIAERIANASSESTHCPTLPFMIRR